MKKKTTTTRKRKTGDQLIKMGQNIIAAGNAIAKPTGVYKVWLEVEYCDEATDTYETIDCLNFASTATFNTLPEAVAFAKHVHAEMLDGVVLAPETEFRLNGKAGYFQLNNMGRGDDIVLQHRASGEVVTVNPTIEDDLEEVQTCDECGEAIPFNASGQMQDDHHATSCSLHPANEESK